VEDLIIAKLNWIQEIFSERQLDDIKNLLQNPEIDHAYVQHWCKQLNLKTFSIL
jgi:hypothetical protein